MAFPHAGFGIQNGGQVTVRESQAAAFVNEGRASRRRRYCWAGLPFGLEVVTHTRCFIRMFYAYSERRSAEHGKSRLVAMPAVESIPGKVSGAWVFRGTRVPVAAIFENLKTSPLEEVLENFHVTREQVQTVLDFSAAVGMQ